MNHYTVKLRAYLDQNPIGYTNGDSLLEQLYWCYIESNRFDSAELRKQFQQLYYSLPMLSEAQFDEVFSAVSALSVEQEKLSFQIGMKLGFRMAWELLESHTEEQMIF